METLQEECFKNGIFLCKPQYDGTGSFAHKLVQPDTEEYYRLCSEQVTIPKRNPYELILNEEGLALLNRVKQQAENQQFDAIFVLHYLINTKSGSWFPNENSSHYKSGGFCCLNSWNNKVIQGHTQESVIKQNGDFVQSDVIVFYTDDWAYSEQGFLYKLENK